MTPAMATGVPDRVMDTTDLAALIAAQKALGSEARAIQEQGSLGVSMLWFRRRAPFQLERGLFLEKAKVLLPWRASIDILRRSAKSEYPSADRITLIWTGETAFGGLPVSISWNTIFPETFFLTLTDTIGKSAIDGYNVFLPKLVERFGNPQRERADDGRPEAGWSYGSVSLGFFVWDRDLVTISVSMCPVGAKRRR